MTSANKQMAAQFNWASFGKATELKKRLLFTLLALMVLRLGTHIPLPGIDAQILAEIFKQKSGSVLGIFDMFSGGALQRMAIFALGIMPYISASIAMMILTYAIPSLAQLRKEGELGRKKIGQYTRYWAIVVAAIQGYLMAVGLESLTGTQGAAVLNPGMMFRFTSVVSLVGGTAFLIWLCEQISARGIGQGTSMVIFAGIVAGLPSSLTRLSALGREGAVSTPIIILIGVLVVAIVTFVVFIERAQRRILVQYPKRQVGMKIMGGESQHLPLLLNQAGVLPAIFASMLLALPLTATAFSGSQSSGIFSEIVRYLQPGQPVHMLVFAVLIIFFTFFCVGLVFNPVETAENLRKAGGFVPGIRPGKNTADYFNFVLKRISAVGAAYVTFICLLPEIFIVHYGIPFSLGGTSVLIVVGVTMTTVAQIHSYLIAHQYEGLMRKSRLKKAPKKGTSKA